MQRQAFIIGWLALLPLLGCGDRDRGWVKYHSTEAGFRIVFPGKPTEQRFEPRAGLLKTNARFTIPRADPASRSEPITTYYASCVTRAKKRGEREIDEALASKAFPFDKGSGDNWDGYAAKNRRMFVLGGIPGWEAAWVRDERSTAYRTRSYETAERSFFLMVWSTAPDKVHDPAADRFFDSLEIEGEFTKPE